MLGAELIDLMVNFVVDPDLIVVGAVRLDCRTDMGELQAVDDFDALKVDLGAAVGAARDVMYGVGLKGGLDDPDGRDERHLEVEAGRGDRGGHGAAEPVDTDVALGDLVEGGAEDHRDGHGEAAQRYVERALHGCTRGRGRVGGRRRVGARGRA